MTKKRPSDVVSIGRIDTVATSIRELETLGNQCDLHAARSMPANSIKSVAMS